MLRHKNLHTDVMSDSSVALILAPPATNTFITSLSPFRDAQCNGVRSILSLVLTSIPLAINTSTTFACPFNDAICNSVLPQFLTLTSAPLESKCY